jgi:hypothetical protein
VLECAYRAARGMSLDSPRDFQVKNASINRFVWDGAQLQLEHWAMSTIWRRRHWTTSSECGRHALLHAAPCRYMPLHWSGEREV